MSRHLGNATRLFFLALALLALLPVGRLALDWYQLAAILPDSLNTVPPRGYDWIQWDDVDGSITATYVFPNGPAYEAGVRTGDVLYHLDYQQYFSDDDLKRAVKGISPGSTRTYALLRGEEVIPVQVRFTMYPTFLYPLSARVWSFSLWGFTVGAFLHLLALIIVGPLAYRSRTAKFSLLLILASSIWVFGNLARLYLISMVGPPDVAGYPYREVFTGLSLVSWMGWIVFPGLLLHKVVIDSAFLRREVKRLRYVLYMPAILLYGAAVITIFKGSIGPITLDALIAPILFYVCCYIAASGGLILLIPAPEKHAAATRWGRAGSTAVLLLAGLAALSVLGIVPLFGAVADVTVGWLIVGIQLLSIAPVALVSIATLRYGKVDQVLSRALTYLTVLGLIFFAFVGGLSLLEPLRERLDVSWSVFSGIYMVVLLVIFERVARQVRLYAASFFATDRQRSRQNLSRFSERMRSILDFESLTRETVHVTGESLNARSAVLFLQPGTTAEPCYIAAYHPEPPYLTERILLAIWPHIQEDGRIWSRNPELNEADLPENISRILGRHSIVLAVPVKGDSQPIGVLLLGDKRRLNVYNLDDVELLRSTCGQLGLAVERLNLIEREMMLSQKHAEAQLVALRAQINPHFLFNALNTIAALIDEKPQEAESAVEHLAGIFRYVLQAGSRPFVTLDDEFTLVSNYLAIEEARFDGKLEVELEMDASLKGLPVPAFAIQTLVENAVKHGIEKRRGGGTIRVLCRAYSEDLAEIEVSDTGIGIPALFAPAAETPEADAFFGLGLRNVSTRLEQLYERDDLLRFSSSAGEGTRAILRLPRQHERSNDRRPHALPQRSTFSGAVTRAPEER